MNPGTDKGPGEHTLPHSHLASMQALPDKVRKLIKKQYLCQRKTFAERLNPHSWSCAAAPSAVLDATPSYPVPPEQTPSWVGWTSLGLPHSGIPSTLQRRGLGRVCADLGGGQCSQLCLHGWKVPVGTYSELLRALLGESWGTRQARALMGTQRQEWAKPAGLLTQVELREGHRTWWGGAVHIVRESRRCRVNRG